MHALSEDKKSDITKIPIIIWRSKENAETEFIHAGA
jgi:hypothetical protein